MLLAASKGETDEVIKLLELGFDINTPVFMGGSALHVALTHGRVELANFLLDHPQINIKVLDNNGNSVLHAAAQGGSLELVGNLVGRVENVNALNNRGQTALHIVAWKIYCTFRDSLEERMELSNFLIANGVDERIRENSGETFREIIDQAISITNRGSHRSKELIHLTRDQGGYIVVRVALSTPVL